MDGNNKNHRYYAFDGIPGTDKKNYYQEELVILYNLSCNTNGKVYS
jgi:hypothetical protein